jgi:hypothetical protein
MEQGCNFKEIPQEIKDFLRELSKVHLVPSGVRYYAPVKIIEFLGVNELGCFWVDIYYSYITIIDLIVESFLLSEGIGIYSITISENSEGKYVSIGITPRNTKLLNFIKP